MGTGPTGKYMLGQVAERRIYEGSETDANLKQCQVTTWAPWASAGSSWHPLRTWTWNAGKIAPPAFRAFNHTTLSLNTPPWKAASVVDARDAYGRVQQESNPLGVADCALYGHGGNFSFARVAQRRGVPRSRSFPAISTIINPACWTSPTPGKRTQPCFSPPPPISDPLPYGCPPAPWDRRKASADPLRGGSYVFSAWVYPIAVSRRQSHRAQGAESRRHGNPARPSRLRRPATRIHGGMAVHQAYHSRSLHGDRSRQSPSDDAWDLGVLRGRYSFPSRRGPGRQPVPGQPLFHAGRRGFSGRLRTLFRVRWQCPPVAHLFGRRTGQKRSSVPKWITT